MNRPLRRPGYPWPGQFGLGPQTVDEIVRRLNERPSGPPPRQQLGIRWVSPITDGQFQNLIDDSIVGPSEENRLFIAQEQRLSDDEVNGYCPSMWVQWAESDTESDNQTKYSIDVDNEPFKVYFPQFAWMRTTSASVQADRLRMVNRMLSAYGTNLAQFGARTGARVPVFFNPRTGNWEVIALTETLPDHFVGVYKGTADGTNILPAVYNAVDDDWQMGYGYVKPFANKDLSFAFHTLPPTAADGIKSELLDNFLIPVFNWTDAPILRDIPYLYWLDTSSGFYMVVKQLEMLTVTVPDLPLSGNGLEHGESTPCTIDGTSTVIDVYNQGQYVFSGSKANVIWSNTNKRFEIVNAFSATKIRGTIVGSFSGNSSYPSSLVSSISPLDGHIHPSPGLGYYVQPVFQLSLELLL